MDYDNWVLNDVEEITEQLVERFRCAIFSQIIKCGEQMPFSQYLANLLNIELEDVSKAYQVLVFEGILLHKDDNYFVISETNKLEEIRDNRISSQCFHLLLTIKNFGYSKKEAQNVLEKCSERIYFLK